MSTDVEARLREWLASAPQTRYAIIVLSISHSLFTQPYHLWRERQAGTVTDENSNELSVIPTNFDVSPAGSPANLDQVFDIAIDTTDADDVFRDEIDRIPLSNNEPIVVVYRAYLSDDLSEPQAVNYLQAEGVVVTRGQAAISAASPRLNVSRTGELYTMGRFPMQRGFL